MRGKERRVVRTSSRLAKVFEVDGALEELVGKGREAFFSDGGGRELIVVDCVMKRSDNWALVFRVSPNRLVTFTICPTTSSYQSSTLVFHRTYPFHQPRRSRAATEEGEGQVEVSTDAGEETRE